MHFVHKLDSDGHDGFAAYDRSVSLRGAPSSTYLVTFLKSRDFRADFNYFTRAIRASCNGKFGGEWIESLFILC